MDFTGFDIAVGVFVLLAILVILAGVKQIPQGYNYTIERFGKYVRTLRPGLNLIIPFIDRVGAKLNMMEQVLDVPTQEVITRDNASVSADGVMFFQILDAARAAYEVRGLENALLNQDFTRMSVHNIMTTNPKVISRTTLASTATAMMNDMKMTILFVTENDKPVGLIHMHDLLRAGVA